MKNAAAVLGAYGRYHRKPETILTDFVGVPLIYLGILVVLSWVSLPLMHISLSWIAVIGLLACYIYIDPALGLVSTAFLLPLTLLAGIMAGFHFNFFSLGMAVSLFVFGWAAQLLGHYLEGNRRVVLGNFNQVFIAPLFLVAEFVFLLGFRKELEREMKNAKGT